MRDEVPQKLQSNGLLDQIAEAWFKFLGYAAEVVRKALALSRGVDDLVEVARACFQFVRDEIKHSWDYKLNPVTCRASEVLQYGTGFCPPTKKLAKASQVQCHIHTLVEHSNNFDF